nr:MAG TPA: hypothetical protein [Caudoviricetes sp.]
MILYLYSTALRAVLQELYRQPVAQNGHNISCRVIDFSGRWW